MRFAQLLLVLGGLLASLGLQSGIAAAAADKPLEDPKVRAFIEEVALRHKLERSKLEALFSEAQFTQKVLDAFSRPAESKPWHVYRKIFLTRSRIDGGARFWQANEAILRAAQAKFGVPPEIITAIIGVETNYGRHKGRLRVLDALTTLAFRYPRRAKFFRGELEAFLLLVGEEGLPAQSLKGSYAGAVGFPQFIPSSYRAYAVDFDGDGRRDLLGSLPDAIGSVANYLKRHRWRAGKPVALRVTGVARDDPRLARRSLKPKLEVRALSDSGVVSASNPLAPGKVVLFALEGGKGSEYWIGYRNFYAITRYNPSRLYAMAVYQLSLAIQEAHAKLD